MANTLESLSKDVQKFCEERDWDQYHGVKDLAIGVVTEGAELLEPFRFLSDADCERLMKDPAQKELIADELADVFFFLLRIGGRYGVDLEKALHAKLEKNAKKYPVDKARGKNTKYDRL